MSEKEPQFDIPTQEKVPSEDRESRIEEIEARLEELNQKARELAKEKRDLEGKEPASEVEQFVDTLAQLLSQKLDTDVSIKKQDSAVAGGDPRVTWFIRKKRSATMRNTYAGVFPRSKRIVVQIGLASMVREALDKHDVPDGWRIEESPGIY
ncbi:hypothetical protein MYX06_03385 [Patescibacteria group bacterium AH-259-L05]|nr:hypothetical protein [Patescibacteria group bacterium AH-259-L05]